MTVEMEFTAEVWFWRGPAPHHFRTVPDDNCGEVEVISPLVSYGWGMIPVTAQVGCTEWATSLFPKNGGYIVPIKADVRRVEGINVDDAVTIRLSI